MWKKIRNTFGPIFLIVVCPLFVMLLWHTNAHLHGSLDLLWKEIQHEGLFSTIYNAWMPYFLGSKKAWMMLGAFAAMQLIFMKTLPGKLFYGPITPKGNIPVYKANGTLSYSFTMVLFLMCSYYFKWFSPTIVYDNFGEILGALTLFSYAFCLFLYFKGRFFPSSSDNGTTGNFIFDYYWGTELYPRILGWDLKKFTNCRFGMMSWGLILLSYAAKQKELYTLSDSMMVSVALQLLYISKFFLWETGYLRSLDIMHDRAGFYICWGCLVWVPSVYTSVGMYLVHNPYHLGMPIALFIFACGACFILMNYFADKQRFNFRLLQGNCKVWGKDPIFTMARYQTEKGEIKKSLLLASGWWGISRHFHYVPEILGALFWTLPALFYNFIPYFYVLFLTVLLTDRAHRDDLRCGQKYGNDWQEHCKKVRYKIIPFIY